MFFLICWCVKIQCDTLNGECSFKDQTIAPLTFPKKTIGDGWGGDVELVVHDVLDTGTLGGQVKMRFAP